MVFDFEFDRAGLYYGAYTGNDGRSPGYAYYGAEWDGTRYKAVIAGSYDNLLHRYYCYNHPGEHRDPVTLLRAGICDEYEELVA